MECRICGKYTTVKYCDTCESMIALAKRVGHKHRACNIWFCGSDTMAGGDLKDAYVAAYDYFKKYHDIKVKEAERDMRNYKSSDIPIYIRKLFSLYNFYDKCRLSDKGIGSQYKTCRCCGQVLPAIDFMCSNTEKTYCSYCRSIAYTEDLPTYHHNPIAIYHYKSMLYREHMEQLMNYKCDK